jgi:hypothetical protein
MAVRRRQLKKFMLVTPADHWPHADSGLGMRAAGMRFLGGRLLQVDTFTARRYSLHSVLDTLYMF